MNAFKKYFTMPSMTLSIFKSNLFRRESETGHHSAINGPGKSKDKEN